MTVQKRKIGLLEVHPVGLGCMNLSHAYGPAQDHDDAVAFYRSTAFIIFLSELSLRESVQ